MDEDLYPTRHLTSENTDYHGRRDRVHAGDGGGEAPLRRCLTAQLWLVRGIGECPKFLTPFPQKPAVTPAQSVPSALAVTVKVIILQFGSPYREHHPNVTTARHPLTPHTTLLQQRCGGVLTPALPTPPLKQLKLCQTPNALAEALRTMCLPEANDFPVHVEVVQGKSQGQEL